jgi:hypothetical protein
MGKITWTDSVRNGRSITKSHGGQGYPIPNKKKANCTCHILHSDGVLKHVTEGKIEGISDGKTRKRTYAVTG